MATDALSHQAIQGSMNRAQPEQMDQYTLWQILGIWGLVTVPMALLGWVAYPAMSAGRSAVDAALLRINLLTVGLIWQFVLSMIILYREEGNIRLSTISRRFWLNHPISAKTRETKKSLWWWIIPLFLLTALLEITLRSTFVSLTGMVFPFLAEPKGYDGSALLAPELRAQWVGAWGLLGMFFVNQLFNTFLGEEFLFRGVLLPKMEGLFGKWDWVANAAIFAFYHLHQPWGILDTIMSSLIFTFSSKRFHSNWFSIILHSGQSVFFLVLLLGLVFGLA
jgi:membrane protease YdiL (CAAX protease family)